jgi:spermidine synthase
MNFQNSIIKNPSFLLIAIFLSGTAALIYQSLWLRALGLIFGTSSFAVAIVLSVFMLGLGLGSFIFGKLSEKVKHPKILFVVIELLIAILAMTSFMLLQDFSRFESLYYFTYNHTNFFILSLVRFLISFFILLPPSILIGGTIPVISKYCISSKETLGSQFGLLYTFNTLGAFVGVLLTGFLLIWLFGTIGTLSIAISLNVLAAFFGLLTRDNTIQHNKKLLNVPPITLPNNNIGSFWIIFFVTGFLMFSYEVLWARVLSAIGLSTTHSYTIVISGFLLGIVIGAYIVSNVADKIKNISFCFTIISAIVGILGVFILSHFSNLHTNVDLLVRIFIKWQLPWNYLLAQIFHVLAVALIPAIFMGMLFPLAIKLYTSDINNVGQQIGTAYFANTLGAVLGSLTSGLVFIPFLGIEKSSIIISLIAFTLALYTALRRYQNLNRIYTSFLYAVYFALIGFSIYFTIGSTSVYDTYSRGHKILYYATGLTATVTVLEHTNNENLIKELSIDRQIVAGDSFVNVIDAKLLAHIPLLIAYSPNTALSVGYGTGGTSYSMLQHKVFATTVEIEKKVLDARQYFLSMNHNTLNHPALRIIIDDARSYLQATEELFDVIVTDVTNLKYKSNPYLYTVEYFSIIKSRLNQNGVAAAWVPLSGLSFEELRTLIATFHHVFPHSTIWYYSKHATHFIIIVGTSGPLVVSLDTLENKVNYVAADLKEIGALSHYDLAASLFLGENDIKNLTTGVTLHTDNHPILEFSNIIGYIVFNIWENLGNLVPYQKENLTRYFKGSHTEMEKLEHALKDADAMRLLKIKPQP